MQLQLETAKSKLMGWFAYNVDHLDGRYLLYQQCPEQYVFLDKEKQWQKRNRGFTSGRMHYCNPLQGERFYLQLLLTVIPGAKSFEHL